MRKNKLLLTLAVVAVTSLSVATSEVTSVKAVETKSTVTATSIPPVLNGIKVNKKLIGMNYSKGVTITPKYIVIHDTDNRNRGANAMANRNYFANHIDAQASAHYTVDQGNIVQCLEDNWRGWHVGDGNNPLISNDNTIAIELCVNSDNDFNKTLENGIALTKYLMTKYNIPANNVVRHYDVSGKICPKMMIRDQPQLWGYFKNAIADIKPVSSVTAKPKAKGNVTNISSYLNVRQAPSSSSAVVSRLTSNQEVNIYDETGSWYKIDYSVYGVKYYGYVSKSYVKKQGVVVAQSVKKGIVVNVSSLLNVRSGASTSYPEIGHLANGNTVTINYSQNGWYNITLSDGRKGFVKADYIKQLN